MRTISTSAVVPVLVAVAPLLAAQAHEERKLVTVYGENGDAFGASVSTFGDRALVGAPAADDAGPNSGAAYVFARDATGHWSEEATLFADIGPEHLFGHAVALFGDRALVGAPGADDAGFASGAVHVFEQGSSGAWIERARLVASDADAQDYFGWSVALFGDRALIGAFLDEERGTSAGSAYQFERDASGLWTQTAKLLAPDGDSDDGFGVAVALFGDRALVGASGDEDHGDASGSAYLLERADDGTWQFVQELLAGDGAALDVFGASVSLVGDRALVGAYGDDDLGDSAGSAYVFARAPGGQWIESAKLLASDGGPSDLFGAVSICGHRAVIGARLAGGIGTGPGAAYVFESKSDGTWTETGTLHASDASDGDHFGCATSLIGDRVLVGARQEDHAGTDDAGAAYVYALGPGETYCQSTANSTGAAALLSVTGSASASANELSLVALPVPAGTGTFVFGRARVRLPFGNGVRCVGGPLVRLPPASSSNHVLEQRLDLRAPPLLGNLVAGSTWHVQAVFRDLGAGGAAFDTSSAVTLTLLL